MNAFKARRLELGLTQLDVARMVGVDDNTVSLWETENRRPYSAVMGRVCKAMQKTKDELFPSLQKPIYKSKNGYISRHPHRKTSSRKRAKYCGHKSINRFWCDTCLAKQCGSVDMEVSVDLDMGHGRHVRGHGGA